MGVYELLGESLDDAAGEQPIEGFDRDTYAEVLRAHVVEKIGAIARPKMVMFTPELPKTRSGKIMRRLLRDIAEHRTLGDVTTLADSGIVETIRVKAQSSDADQLV